MQWRDDDRLDHQHRRQGPAPWLGRPGDRAIVSHGPVGHGALRAAMMDHCRTETCSRKDTFTLPRKGFYSTHGDSGHWHERLCGQGCGALPAVTRAPRHRFVALAVAARTGARFILISSSSVLYAPGDQEGLTEGPAPATPPVNDYARAARLRLLPRFRRDTPAQGDLVSIDTLVRQVARAVEGKADGILHVIDPAPVAIEAFVKDALTGVGLPGPSVTMGMETALRTAAALEVLSMRTGWWEPPLTRFGVEVFTATKTFDDTRARAALGPPDVPTNVAVDRFVRWWRKGARLDDPPAPSP